MITHLTSVRDEATFPEEWHSGDVPGTFRHDVMHFPYPLSPMSGSLITSGFTYGHRKASRELSLGIRFQAIIVNHFRFDGALPEQHAEDDAREPARVSEASMRLEMGRLLERWREDHLPAIERLLGRLREMNPRGLPADQRLAMLDDMLRIQEALWTIHVRVAMPMMVSMQVFSDFYAEALGGTMQDAHGLLIGTNSQSIAAGIALGDLADSACAWP